MTPRGVKVVALSVVLGSMTVLLSGCNWSEVLGLGWPRGITPEAHLNRELWIGSVIASLVVGVIVWGLIFWTSAFHRHKKGDTELPRQFGYNMPLELVLTVIPFLIISVLFYFTVVVQNYVDEKQADPDVQVDVTAYQWNWKFGYRTIDLKDGAAKYEGTDEEEQAAAEAAATPGEGAEGSEDGEFVPGAIHGAIPQDLSYLHYNKIETVGSSAEIPVLVLPTGKRIEFVLASSDVIHGFWVPEFLFKRDVLPNPEENHSDNVFQISEIEREGSFVGRCTEMCGTFHSMMNFEVRAVSPDKFEQYIELRKPLSEGGEALTNAQALEAIGESPLATSTSPFETDRTVRTATVAEGN